MSNSDIRYLSLLSETYPTPEDAAAEAARLRGYCAFPRENEVFASDIHGEYAAFSHLIRGGCGMIEHYADEVFGTDLSAAGKTELLALIRYPQEKVSLAEAAASDVPAWQAESLTRLVAICKRAAEQRPYAKVLEVMPDGFSSVIEELLHASDDTTVASLIAASIDAGCASELIVQLCDLIQRLAIDRLHLVGDVYDRGPAPEAIMEELMAYHSVDVQWGNHDIVWMGASLGQRGCIAHVVRNCARYGNLTVLEDAYGINLRPLASFALSAYADDPCVAFGLKGNPGLSEDELELNVKIQKAMAIIQFKVEAQIIDEYPEYGLDDRKLLHMIDPVAGTVVVDGITYDLTDNVFPTVDWDDPYQLTPEEEHVMQCLQEAFIGCEKLQRHMAFFLEYGSMYNMSNGFLMFHACTPLNADGSLMEVDVYGEKCKGRALYDAVDRHVKAAFFSDDPIARKRGRDLIWWLWLAPGSPLFAKSKMATFELYLIAEKEARTEVKNPFYKLYGDADVVAGILEDFGMDPISDRIVCGHVPVKVKDGEDPVKCDGRVFCIDGGFSAAYQKTTGIAGFTLTSNANGIALASHKPLESREGAIDGTCDIESEYRVITTHSDEPIRVAETDQGKEAIALAADLEELIDAYSEGLA